VVESGVKHPDLNSKVEARKFRTDQSIHNSNDRIHVEIIIFWFIVTLIGQ